MKELCRRDYQMDVDTRLVGKTLYVGTVLDGLVGQDLSLRMEMLNKLEGAMLNSVRVALSTDAELNFLVLKARDSRLGVSMTLIRYFPDVKSLLYYRISRSDSEDRLVFETINSAEQESPDSWKDITMTEFYARLAASRMGRLLSSNPLVGVFLQIHRVRGDFGTDGVMYLTVDKYTSAPSSHLLTDEILKTAVVDIVSDIIGKYGAKDIITAVTVKDETGKILLTLKENELIKSAEQRKNTKHLG
ncbi:MAG TPA: hypothetical protein PK876_02205 [Elusimicrobiota bacterium]|nr:hypothetical protein [Elusimicrobiota bacterium]